MGRNKQVNLPMKIFIVIDKKGTAISRLADAVKKYSPHLEIEILAVHPKRPDVESLHKAVELMEWCDIIDIHYWKSGEVLRRNFKKLFDAKPKILFHFNPYDVDKQEVNDFYDLVVVGNEEIQSRIPYANLVPYGIDLDTFKFNEDYTEEKVVNMTVSRIEGKKGVREVAQACKDLEYKFKLVGRVSKEEYMNEVRQVAGDDFEFYNNVPDEKMLEIYRQSAIHVCNSVDNFESGTLPVLESMIIGIPVLTRNVGHIPDLFNGKNMVVRSGEQNDIEDLRKNLKEMMENRDWRLKLREKAWDTARARDIRKMVREIRELYYRVYMSEDDFSSIIIPTKDKPEAFIECLVGALSQDFKKYEIVVADSGDTSVKPIVDEARKNTNIPIKYIHFLGQGRYTLAEARNRAIVEAEGKWLLFCDDRIRMEPNVLGIFNQRKGSKIWFWGMKDNAVKSFVENFSYVNRKELISGGMFCERINVYGGTTQEIRARFERGNNFTFAFIQDAKATGTHRAGSKKSRRDNIIEAKIIISKLHD